MIMAIFSFTLGDVVEPGLGPLGKKLATSLSSLLFLKYYFLKMNPN